MAAAACAIFAFYTLCRRATARSATHEVSGALLESRVSKGWALRNGPDTQRTRTRPPRHRELHEAGGAAAPEDTRPTRYCSPPLANTPPSTPRWHTASSNRNQPTCNHDIHAHTQSLYGVSVRYPSAPLRAHSLSSQTDRRQTDILPVCDPGSCLFCLLDLVIDLVSHRRQYRHVTLHATIGSRPWPALGVALIKRTIVPIFSRRPRAYAEPFRSARPAATGACGRRAPRGHHHTCSGCAVLGW